MLATGWDYPTLRDTPQGVVEEMMIFHRIHGEYVVEMNKKAEGEQTDAG